MWAGLLGTIFWGLAPIAGKLGLHAVDPLAGLALRTLIASALVFGFVLGAGGWVRLDAIPFRAWVPIGVEALFATLAGDLAYYVALKNGSAATVALVMSASPLVTVAAAWGLLGEPVPPLRLLGALLIVAGVALVGHGPGR